MKLADQMYTFVHLRVAIPGTTRPVSIELQPTDGRSGRTDFVVIVDIGAGAFDARRDDWRTVTDFFVQKLGYSYSMDDHYFVYDGYDVILDVPNPEHYSPCPADSAQMLLAFLVATDLPAKAISGMEIKQYHLKPRDGRFGWPWQIGL